MLSRTGLLLALACAAFVPHALAGDKDYVPPLDELMHDTMKSDPDPSTVDMVWWIPTDFWRATFANNPDVSASQAQKMVDAMDRYAMFAIVQGRMGPLGAVEFRETADVRAGLSLLTPAGATLLPIPADKLTGDAALFAQMMKPMLARMLGPMGEHLEFYFFENKATGGGLVVDPTADATFTVQVGTQGFTWQLPLESLFAPVDCGKCGRELKGTWTYCPYDGTKVKH